MFRSILSLTLSLIAGAALLSSSAAAEPQYSRGPGAIPLSYDDDHYGRDRWDERTCCQRDERWGYRIFWSTKGECRRTRGHEVTNKTCRKYGGFHAYDRRDRQYDGGYGRGDGHDDWRDGDRFARVCCVRDGHVWWSNRSECRRARGDEAMNKVCRRN